MRAYHVSLHLVQMVMERDAVCERTLTLELGHADIPYEPGTFDTGCFFRCGRAHVEAIHFPSSMERMRQYLSWLTQTLKGFPAIHLDAPSAEIVVALVHFVGANTYLFVAAKAGNRDFLSGPGIGTRRTLPGSMMPWQALDFFLFAAPTTHNHGLETFLGSNAVLDNLVRDIPCGRSTVASGPERGKTAKHHVLLAEMMYGEPLALFDDVCR